MSVIPCWRIGAPVRMHEGRCPECGREDKVTTMSLSEYTPPFTVRENIADPSLLTIVDANDKPLCVTRDRAVAVKIATVMTERLTAERGEAS